MTTKEKINENPFNSDHEEKLLLDELISTSHSDKRLYISHNDTFTYVHEKTCYDNMCKIPASASCEGNKKCFMPELKVKSKVRRGKSRVC
jgi:hypothetical protein